MHTRGTMEVARLLQCALLLATFVFRIFSTYCLINCHLDYSLCRDFYACDI
jgi:hypothetical protein